MAIRGKDQTGLLAMAITGKDQTGLLAMATTGKPLRWFWLNKMSNPGLEKWLKKELLEDVAIIEESIQKWFAKKYTGRTP